MEIILDKKDFSPKVIFLKHRNKLIEFSGKDCLESLMDFIKKKKKIKIYILDMEELASALFLLSDRGGGEVKVFAVSNKIYYIKITLKGSEVIFKNLSLFLTGSNEGFSDVLLGSYVRIRFYPGTSFKLPEKERYTIPSENEGKDEELKKLIDRLTSLNTKNPSYEKKTLESFYHKEGEENEIEIKKKIMEIPDILERNLRILGKQLGDIDLVLRILHRGWYYNYSIPSVSIEIFNKLYNNYEVELECESEMDEKIRPAYIGGRCEVFGNPYTGEKILHYDFESMYGQVMLENFPTGGIEIVKNIENLSENGFYYVTVHSSRMEIPILPIKNLDEALEDVV